MKNLKKLILLIIIISSGAIIFSMGLNLRGKQPEPLITSSTIKEQIKGVKELTTTKYQYTNVGSFENQNEFYGFKIPLTLKKFIISFDGQIASGIDLEKMDVKIVENVIKIKLPKAEILSHEIDENSIKIFDEKDSIFNPIKLEDYSGFRQDQKEAKEKEALSKGLLNEAKTNAEKAIKSLLMLNPEIAENYAIEFIN